MGYNYRSIAVYFDSTNKLIGFPNGVFEKWNAMMQLDCYRILTEAYLDDQLEAFLMELFSLCYSEEPNENSSPLQTLTKTKSYKSSVKNLGLVSSHWVENEGYTITPTWQSAKDRNSFLHIEDKAIKLPEDYKPGELAVVFRKAMEMSPIGPQMSAPVLD